MNIIGRWNEYMGPKDERLAAETNRYMKIGYYILLFGALLCLYYGIMVEQVSSTTDTPIYTKAGSNVFPVNRLMIIVVLAACIIPLAMEVRSGIISDRGRYASVTKVPWDFVMMLSLLVGALVGILTCTMRMVAEIQIVGISQVTWMGDIAMGIVFFIMAFVLAAVIIAAVFKSAIKNRMRLEEELELED